MSAAAMANLSVRDVEAPWYGNARGLPPGKQRHIADMVACLGYGDGWARVVPTINPLFSQPIVDYCLSLPTYLLATGGEDRGLARLAFEDILAPEVRRRQTKASGGAFVHELVRANRTRLRPFLLDGVLSAAGLLDKRRLEASLAPDVLLSGDAPFQLLDATAVEGWARRWCDAGVKITG